MSWWIACFPFFSLLKLPLSFPEMPGNHLVLGGSVIFWDSKWVCPKLIRIEDADMHLIISIYIYTLYIYILNIYLSNLTINWYCLCIYYILFLTYVCMPSGTPLVVDVLGVDGFSCWNPNFGQFGRPFLVASPCFLRTSSSIVAENSPLLSAKSTFLLLKSCWIPMFAC